MKQYLSALIIAICLVSCDDHSKHWDTISQVESYIEERPDSALVVLEQINVADLSGKEEKAKHALLYSMALDKNFIDKTDFGILQPAIDYYENNGSATDKLRTYYYQGRIYQNQGNDAWAITCYVNALENGSGSNDVLTKARLYVAQGNIYISLLKWDDAIKTNMIAAQYFYETNRIDSYVNCLLKVSNCHIKADNYDDAKIHLDNCSNYLDNISNKMLGKYYAARLTLLIEIGNNEKISTTIEEYLNSVREDDWDYLTIANAYVAINENDKALDILLNKDYSLNTSQEMKYWATLAEIYENQNKHKLALEAYQKYYDLHDAMVNSVFESDTQFAEERHSLELQNIHERESKNKIILTAIVVFSLLIAIIIYIRWKLKYRAIKQVHAEKEAERYRLLYEQIEYEKENLSELLTQNTDIDNSIREVVTKRIELLNKFFTVYITNNSEISRKVDKELDELLANKASFMSSTRLAFAGSHPKFIKYLEEHNLTEKEIEYCCMYALGLKGKEVGAYMKMRSHFNMGSDIRKKLGLVESDTNLGIYVRKLLVTL